MEDLYKIIDTWVPREVKDKRYAATPDLSLLKGDQSAAFETLREFLNDRKQTMYVLEGTAGSGKSFLVNMLIEHCLAIRPRMKVAMGASTNKAYKQLVKMAEYKHTNLTYATVHSLLSLKEVIKDDGTIAFEPDYQKPGDKKLDEFDLLIVDEVSMLNDQVFKYLLPYTENDGSDIGHRLKIVFVGDSSQIPPVREASEKRESKGEGLQCAIPLSEEGRKKYKIGYVRMDAILRQALDNPIIRLATEVRKSQDKKDFVLPEELGLLPDGRGYYVMDQEDVDSLYEMLEKYYCSDKFEQSSDFIRTIAWTNKMVDSMNREIRSMLFGDDIPGIVSGDRLISTKPVFENNGERDEIIYTTNDEFRVIDVKEAFILIDDVEFKYYNTVTEYVNPDGVKEVKKIKILHEDSQKAFMKLSKERMMMAKGEPRGSRAAKIYWKLYWDLQKFFAQVGHQYCTTVHRSQGSTFGICVVMLRNILRNPDFEERNHILYTAFTRPSDLLIIVK